MLDKLLNIGCAFDWITPTIAFIQDFLGGPVSDFGIPANPYLGRSEIRRLLMREGIHVWGLMYDFHGEVLMFTVNKLDAEFTCHILLRNGIPIMFAPKEIIELYW